VPTNELDSVVAHCRSRGFIIEPLAQSRWRVTSPTGTVEVFDAGQMRNLAIINQWEPPMSGGKVTLIDGHEHDGTRRWAIYFITEKDSRAAFYSDAVTMAGALAHFRRRYPQLKSTHIRRVGKDEWLTKG
jgi:hypothetical protein